MIACAPPGCSKGGAGRTLSNGGPSEAKPFDATPGAHPRLTADGVQRDGATNPQMAGPLGGSTVRRLMGGGGDERRPLILDAWLDADGRARGDAADFIQ